jgi:hypothetical protein
MGNISRFGPVSYSHHIYIIFTSLLPLLQFLPFLPSLSHEAASPEATSAHSCQQISFENLIAPLVILALF